jgi:chaperonin GroES
MIALLSDNVLVKQTKAGEEMKGGLIIPGTIVKEKLEGVVVAVGPGRYASDGTTRLSMDVKPGDYVLFAPHRREAVHMDGEDYLLMGVDTIFCVLEPCDG